MYLNCNLSKGRLILFTILPLFLSCRITKVYTPDSIKLSKEEAIGYFPDLLNESSGLEFYGDSLISFNDSGGGTKLFIFSPLSPQKPVILELTGTFNIDWEDIAADSTYLYLGDFGNNSGYRDTLIIYRIDPFKITENPDFISFSYLEKNNYEPSQTGSRFDCEAITVINDSLWLFTKNWQEETSWIYKLPTEPGHYELNSFAVLQAKMMVTGADFDPDNQILFLIGYKNFTPVIFTYHLKNKTLSKLSRTRFWNLYGLQTEGIVSDGQYLYFSNEKSLKKQGLYRIKINK